VEIVWEGGRKKKEEARRRLLTPKFSRRRGRGTKAIAKNLQIACAASRQGKRRKGTTCKECFPAEPIAQGESYIHLRESISGCREREETSTYKSKVKQQNFPPRSSQTERKERGEKGSQAITDMLQFPDFRGSLGPISVYVHLSPEEGKEKRRKKQKTDSY